MTKYYTGIGSRETPSNIVQLMRAIAHKLSQKGWILRSGGADGADNAFESGWWDSYLIDGDKYTPYRAEIYVPWEGFNYHRHDPERYPYNYVLDKMPEQYQTLAKQIAAVTHPAWDKCKDGAKKLHTRNVFQVLGQDCQTPSKFVVCWATPADDKGHVKGGTATAVKLAIQRDIHVYNLYHEATVERLTKWLEEK